MELELIKNELSRCRICLSNDNHLITILNRINRREDSIKYYEIINQIANIDIRENDEKPQFICLPCAELTRNAYKLKNTCENSEIQLENELKKAMVENIEEIYINENDIKVEEEEDIVLEESRVQNVDLEFKCVECDFIGETVEDFQEHMKLHEGEKQEQKKNNDLNCPHCQFTAMNRPLLGKHMEHEHDEHKTVKCDLCDKKFFHERQLKKHKYIHKGIRAHICDVCGKSFLYRNHLTSHMRVHTGERPFPCEVCDQRFKLSSARWHHMLSKHHRKRTGASSYKCELCDKEYYSKHSLKLHYIIHSGERNYECGGCGKKFKLPTNLAQHLKIHTGLRPHKCQLCDKTYVNKCDLTKHMERHKTKSAAVAAATT